MLKTVLDTNVIISAIAFGCSPRKVFDLAIMGKISSYISESILTELKEVLQRPKFAYDDWIIKAIVHELETLNKTIRDREDYFILSCAIAAEADYLVTGDNDLLILEKYENVKIATPAQFMKMN